MDGTAKRQFWTATEDATIRALYPHRSVNEIAGQLGRSKDAVKHRARKLEITADPSAGWTEEETAYLRENYATLTVAEVATALGRTPVAVQVRANILGLKNVHRSAMASLVPGYFREIDTPIKAYLLGLITADGCISRRNQLALALCEKDRELVELARDEIAPRARIASYFIRGYPQVAFKVQSAGLAADLASHGVVPAKTPITKWPDIPEKHEGSFLCGVSDGDGSLERRWVYHWTLTSGSYDFLVRVRERIAAHTGVKAGNHVYPDRGPGKSNTWRIAVTGMPVRALDAWMHRDVPGLARKRLPPLGQLELDI